MSLYDNVRQEEYFRCHKCHRFVDVQTKGAMRQSYSLSVNELAAYMALFANGNGVLMAGYCKSCNEITYFELQPVTVKQIEDPYTQGKHEVKQ